MAETTEGFALVNAWVAAKVRNQAEFLDELWRRRDGKDDLFESPTKTLADCRGKLVALDGTLDQHADTLRGLEGTAGRAYFGCLSSLMPAEFQFSGRSRHPAKDEFNAFLNYAYGVLYSHVERACILAGLDPFVGFLHTDNYNKKSLVFDLIEPFRILAERATVLLFTGRKVRKDMCSEVQGGMTLNDAGKALLITSLNERLEKTVRYPVKSDSKRKRNIKQRDVIQMEAHSLANRLLGREDLPRIVETEALWSEDEG
ncbi:MAG: CRISPR-associated endonuclease Cas1 [Armatimonadetes bacterium CG2_30_66_41]|nr:CRISPR-associated endonuclease Cas1 [Armatimonadota bacterium]NCP34889.1 CRISPR-associated endonuclease Cas1 [Armatimonadota bacterium]NCQ26395.1 CRISPR-associated endonuclease Cas1 [Armatimonadota bacterium]NDK16335.1 CRISPR-associated endonuclease Cas1 [Armatimonadota bacterium]OIP11583.1 MAG: CRISPR-associated endonuclease Cas1 [Armatimonadetes bacterium CG2_30_66_41]